MEQITVRLSTEVIEELDRIAEESNRSRAEVIRDELNPGEDADEVDRLRNELAATREEYEAEIEKLENEVERLRNEKQTLIRDREERTELVKYVEDELSYREAGIMTRTKWWLFGKKDD